MAGGMVKGPVQVDLVHRAGDAERVRVVSTQGNQEGTLSGRAWIGGKHTQVIGYFCMSINL